MRMLDPRKEALEEAAQIANHIDVVVTELTSPHDAYVRTAVAIRDKILALGRAGDVSVQINKLSPIALRKIDEEVREMGLTGFTYWFEFSQRIESLFLATPQEMFICEIPALILHQDQAYIFRAHPTCPKCADYLKPKPISQETKEQRDLFWPPNGELEEHLYEIRNAKTKEYAIIHAREIQSLHIINPRISQVQISGPQCKNCRAFTTRKRVVTHGLCMKCENEEKK